MEIIPSIPVGQWIADVIDWLQTNLAALWGFIELVLEGLYEWLLGLLLAPYPIALILAAGLIAWVARSWKFAIFALLGFALVESMDLWEETIETLVLVLIATVIAAAVAIPVGVLAARSDALSTALRPVLDFMQTLHPFVYLIPVIFIFSIGTVPGIIATIVFASPPGVRFTELGIRQVDREVVEAGEAFGARPGQILARIQLPLATPTIMAGLNQVIMLSLSMVVLAGFVGAGGLGASIVFSLSRVDVAGGFEAGIAVVILAIFLDRLTGVLGQTSLNRSGGRDFLGRLLGRRSIRSRPTGRAAPVALSSAGNGTADAGGGASAGAGAAGGGSGSSG